VPKRSDLKQKQRIQAVLGGASGLRAGDSEDDGDEEEEDADELQQQQQVATAAIEAVLQQHSSGRAAGTSRLQQPTVAVSNVQQVNTASNGTAENKEASRSADASGQEGSSNSSEGEDQPQQRQQQQQQQRQQQQQQQEQQQSSTQELLNLMFAQMQTMQKQMQEMQKERKAEGIAKAQHRRTSERQQLVRAALAQSENRGVQWDGEEVEDGPQDHSEDDPSPPPSPRQTPPPPAGRLTDQQRRENEEQFLRLAERRRAEPIAPITYCSAVRNAGDSQWLENWLRDLSRQALGMDIYGQGLTDRVQLMLRSVDREMEMWYWHTCERDGHPRQWAEVEARLRQQFITVPASRKAAIALLSLYQSREESLDGFLARVQSLHRTAGAHTQADDEALALKVIYSADGNRFARELGKAMERHSEGKIRNLTELRTLLCQEELKSKMAAQFTARMRNGGQAPAAAAPPSRGYNKSNANTHKRVNNLEYEKDGYEGSDDAEATAGAVGVNALRSDEAPKEPYCVRCKKRGHAVHECKQPDRRVCHKCQKAGHVMKDCKEAKRTPKRPAGTWEDKQPAGTGGSGESKN
jgi:hypothetical protein